MGMEKKWNEVKRYLVLAVLIVHYTAVIDIVVSTSSEWDQEPAWTGTTSQSRRVCCSRIFPPHLLLLLLLVSELFALSRWHPVRQLIKGVALLACLLCPQRAEAAVNTPVPAITWYHIIISTFTLPGIFYSTSVTEMSERYRLQATDKKRQEQQRHWLEVLFYSFFGELLHPSQTFFLQKSYQVSYQGMIHTRYIPWTWCNFFKCCCCSCYWRWACWCMTSCLDYFSGLAS